ncbi:MAG: SDR family oxidoreductase [Anaerolineaceae bacterium]
MDYRHKTALITGGSRGIGLALARKLAGQGANVWILARDPKQLQVAQGLIENDRAFPDQKFGILNADVSNLEEIQTVIDQFLKEAGTPDILVNSAGVVQPGNFEKLAPSDFKWMMDINYLGLVYVTRLVIPGMMLRKSGRVVNISSLAGIVPLYGYSGYTASKFAVRGFSDVLRVEMKPYNIGVSVVFPPDTDTEQLQYDKLHKPEVTRILTESAGVMSAEAVADAILTGISKNHTLILPGLEGKILYRLSHLGRLFTYIMDKMTESALKKGDNNPFIH